MKKLIIAVVTFVFLFIGAQSVFAANPFNGQSGDCNPGMGIGIYPNNIPRDSYGCWTSTYIEAEPGDTINVAMYYHNNTSSTLNNVRGSIVKSSAGPANTFTFTGVMYSDQGSQTIGTVTLKLASKQTLTYSSTHFMKDAVAVKSDIDTKVFHSDGGQMTVGSVPPGWNDYGEFLAVYKVSNTAPVEDTCSVSLTASKTSIKQGENSLLTWNASGCTDTTIYPTLGNVNISDSRNVSPSASTTYTLKGYNPFGVAKTDTVTINVDTAPDPVCTVSLTASTSSITLGGYTKLSWNTNNCTSASIYPTIGSIATNANGPQSGSQNVSPTDDTMYTLTAQGANGQVTDKVTIYVNKPVNNCTATLSASTSSITLGGYSVLSWNTSSGCTSATIYPTVGNITTNNSSSRSVYPTDDTTYTLTAQGANGPVVKTVVVYVNKPSNNCTASLSASDYSISRGESTLLSWNTSNCTSATIYPTVGNISTNTSSSRSVYPTDDTTYTLSAYGTNGLVTKTVVVTVNQPVNNCTATLSASTSSVTLGGSSLLSWNTSSGCTSATIYPNIGNITTNNSSSRSVYPTDDTTYTLTAYGANGPVVKTVIVYVNKPSNNCTASLSASPSSITLGSSSLISWNTSNCTSAAIYPTIGNISTNTTSSRSVNPTDDTTYTLSAYGTNGLVTEKVVVTVNQPSNNCTVSLSASDYSISRGESTTLSWATDNCTSAAIYPTVGNISTNTTSSRSVNPTDDTTYTLSAYGTNGLVTKTVVISVDNNNNDDQCRITEFDVDDTSIEDGDEVRFEWRTEDCDYVRLTGVNGNLNANSSRQVEPSITKTYVLTAYGDSGTDTESLRVYVDEDDNNDNDSCDIDSFTASNRFITVGGSTRLSWDATDCKNVFISYLGNVNDSGSQTVYPLVNTNYVLTAYGNDGRMQTRSVYVTVNLFTNPVPPQPPVVNNCAVTTVATNINQGTAQLNGIITGGAGANTYFEYGTTVNLGYRTASRYANSNTNFSETVTGLTPNTIYYFRMASDCSGGLSLGAIQVFRTQNIQTVVNNKPIIIQQGTTVIGTSSPVMLSITNRYELIGEGDLIDYEVKYKNIGKDILRRPMVQVVLPTNVTLVNSSQGTYSVDTHTLSTQIADLNPGQEGVIFLQGRVDSIPLNNSQIATTAILIYTSSNGSQENAMAYVINVPKIMMGNTVLVDQNSVLGGAAFFGGLFSIGLLGWLLIILLILLIILIARSYSQKRTSIETVTHTTTH